MDYKTITRNSHYYVISHMSSVVRPDAQRIGTAQRSMTKNGLIYSAFHNPDGTYAVVILNNGDEALTAVVSDGQKHFRAAIPAQSVVSCKW